MLLKNITYYFCVLIIVIIWSCEKDLDRDNPLDENSTTKLEEAENDIDSGIVFTRYEIYQDSNSDKVVSKGEFIRLKCFVQNKSLKKVDFVTLKITSSSPYVSSITNYYNVGGYKNVSFGDMAKDQKGNHDGLSFNVAGGTPDSTELVFDVEFESSDGVVWKSTFSIFTEKNTANLIYSSSSVYWDSNSDKIINKGESITMDLVIKNVGASATQGVKVSVSSNSPYVSSIRNNAALGGYIDVGFGSITTNTESSHNGLTFNISANTPNGTLIEFEIKMIDFYGNIWNDTFTILVQGLGANMVYSKHSVINDGNNDGYINKGEGVGLDLSIKNIGVSTVKDVDVTVTSLSPYVSNITYSKALGGFFKVDFGDLSSNQEVSNNGLFFIVSSSAPNGAVINFSVLMEDQYGNSWTDNFSITVAATGSNLILSKSFVFSDTNGNQKAEAGEFIRLTTFVKNIGVSTAKGVKATITSTSTYISSFGNYYSLGGFSNVNYGDLTMNSEDSYSGLMFKINTSTPAGTIIIFNVLLADEHGNTWNDTFNLTTY